MSKKIAAFICCLTFSFTLCAKEYKLTDPPITIEPPVGFIQSARFNGFEQLETFSTIKFEQDEQSVSTVIARQLKNNFDTLDSKNVTINGLEGLLLKQAKNVSGTQFHQQTLFFGDKLGSIILTASYPASMDKSMGPMITKTLLNVKMRRMTQDRLFNNLPFVIKDNGSLTYQMRTLNSVILVDKAPYDSEKVFQPTYTVSHVKLDNAIDEISQFSLNQLQDSQQFDNIQIVEQMPATIAGIKAYKIIATAQHKKNQLPVMFYQVLAANGLKFLLVQAAAPIESQRRFIKEFDHITDNIAFKKAADN